MAVSCDTDTTIPDTPTIHISPESSSIVVGSPAITFQATVDNSSASVLWRLSGAGSLNLAKGSSVEYTPPTSLPATTTATITATLEGSSISDKATITLLDKPLVPKLYVNGDSGLDTNAGTEAKPFKTITKALSVAVAGQTVVPRLDASRAFSTATGESFPLRLKTGVNLEAERLILIGGSGVCLQLESLQNVQLHNLALQCDIGVSVEDSSNVNLSSVNTAGMSRGIGISIVNSQVTLDDIDLLNSQTGLMSSGSSQVTLSNSKLSGNAVGAEIRGNTTFTADNTSFVENTTAGLSILENASVTVNNSFLDRNGITSSLGHGMVLNSEGGNTLTIDKTTFDSNKGTGVRVQLDEPGINSFDITITNSTFSNNDYGLELGDVVGVVELRKNRFAFNTTYQLSDQRPAGATLPLVALETTIDDGMGEYQLSGVETGPDRDGNVWEIIGAGNNICFSSCP
jgi:hypothetical protein